MSDERGYDTERHLDETSGWNNYPRAKCHHCFHIADRDDCQRHGIYRKKIMKCCKCGKWGPLS